TGSNSHWKARRATATGSGQDLRWWPAESRSTITCLSLPDMLLRVRAPPTSVWARAKPRTWWKSAGLPESYRSSGTLPPIASSKSRSRGAGEVSAVRTVESRGEEHFERLRYFLTALDHVSQYLQGNRLYLSDSLLFVDAVGHDARKLRHRSQNAAIFLMFDFYANWLNLHHGHLHSTRVRCFGARRSRVTLGASDLA